MNDNNNIIWYKAAVIGSIWASMEIIFGGFFHSLRLPFAGTFLTFMSIILLVAYSYKWNDRNLFVKAGIIAAVMRSMVPTSVIIGPFVGIITEAVIFQIFINLLGRNFPAFALAGITAMFSAIIHKVVSIIIIYGWDVVKILERLYFMFLKISGLNLPLEQLAYIVVSVYTALGLTAAASGIYIGKNIDGTTPDKIDDFKLSTASPDLFDLSRFNYKPILLFIHFILLVAGFVVLEKYGLQTFLLLFIPYTGFLVFRYRRAFYRLKKIMFWLQLILIVLASIWLWNDKAEGLTAGLKMALRALWVMSLFIAISVELKNPVVRTIVNKKGFGTVYTGIELASGSLPYILSRLSREKKSLLNPVKILRKAIALSEQILNAYLTNHKKKTTVYLISGETGSGKTTIAKEILRICKQKYPQFRISGIITEAVFENGEKVAFFVKDIKTEKTVKLCDKIPDGNKISSGQYYFYKKALIFGNDVLKNALASDLIIIDETGALELKNNGWHEAITYLIRHGQPMIWTVKTKHEYQLIKKYNNTDFRIFHIPGLTASGIISEIINERIG